MIEPRSRKFVKIIVTSWTRASLKVSVQASKKGLAHQRGYPVSTLTLPGAHVPPCGRAYGGIQLWSAAAAIALVTYSH